jgi:hypothetical protein
MVSPSVVPEVKRIGPISWSIRLLVVFSILKVVKDPQEERLQSLQKHYGPDKSVTTMEASSSAMSKKGELYPYHEPW